MAKFLQDPYSVAARVLYDKITALSVTSYMDEGNGYDIVINWSKESFIYVFIC